MRRIPLSTLFLVALFAGLLLLLAGLQVERTSRANAGRIQMRETRDLVATLQPAPQTAPATDRRIEGIPSVLGPALGAFLVAAALGGVLLRRRAAQVRSSSNRS